MKEIHLSAGKVSLIDDEDFEKVNQFKWSFFSHKTTPGYAGRSILVGHRDLNKPKGDSKNQIFKNVSLHRFILNAPEGCHIDHINGDTLDNRRSNLRIVNKSQNAMNSKLRKDNTSGHKGVNWNKIHRRWIARVKVGGKEIFSKSYKTFEEAVEGREKAVKKYHGEYMNEATL